MDETPYEHDLSHYWETGLYHGPSLADRLREHYEHQPHDLNWNERDQGYGHWTGVALEMPHQYEMAHHVIAPAYHEQPPRLADEHPFELHPTHYVADDMQAEHEKHQAGQVTYDRPLHLIDNEHQDHHQA